MKLNTFILSLALFGFVTSTLPMQQESPVNQTSQIVEQRNQPSMSWVETTAVIAFSAFAIPLTAFYLFLIFETGRENAKINRETTGPLVRYAKGLDQKISPEYLFETITSLQNTVAELSKKVTELTLQK